MSRELVVVVVGIGTVVKVGAGVVVGQQGCSWNNGEDRSGGRGRSSCGDRINGWGKSSSRDRNSVVDKSNGGVG